MGEWALGTQPSEGPVDHAKQQHGQWFVQLAVAQVGAQVGDGLGKTCHHTPLAAQHGLSFVVSQELDILGQHPVFVFGSGVGLHESQDQLLQPLSRRQVQRLHLVHQVLQTCHMALGDLGQQAVFVAHVVVQRGLADAAGSGHVLHRGGGIAACGKQLSCGSQHLLALQLEAG